VTTRDGTWLIELGEDWAEPALPARPRPRRRSPALPVAVLLAVGLLPLGGAERVDARLVSIAELPVTDASVVTLSVGTAFVADRAAVSGGGGLVSAYPLPGRAPRWQTRVPVVPQQLAAVPDAGVVVASALTGAPKAMVTTALDAGTGRVLWTTGDGLVAEAPDGLDGVLLDGFPGGAVRWVEPRTGRTVWSHPLPVDGALRLVPRHSAADPALVLVTGLDGAVDVIAERTGAVMATGNVGALDSDAQLGGPHEPAQPGVDATGGRLMVFRPQPSGPGTVTAYDLDTLRPLWTSIGDFDGYAVACGALICLPEVGGMTAVDRDDGAVVWTDDRWTGAEALGGDRVLAYSDQPDIGPAVLAAGTGRVRIPLSGWSPVGDQDGDTSLVTRPAAPGSGRAWVATLPAGGTALLLLGDVPRTVGQSCQAGAWLLACGTARGTIQIWRYRA
jgi:outer membrane protein assembly factor BamB